MKEESRKKAAQDLENIRIEKEKRLAEKQRQKEEEQLALFNNLKKPETKLDSKPEFQLVLKQDR